jgi:hypothetical protein
MKRFLLALSLALLVPACVGEVADPEASSEAAAPEPAPSGRAAASPAPQLLPASCLSTCMDRYDACIANALNDTDACICHNNLVRCEIPCGGHGIIEKCPV